ncbi:MAG: hypothetical protein ACRDLB_05160 [Actinomycetota bacterium]
MRATRALLTLIFLAILPLPAPASGGPQGASLTEGCKEKSWGYRCFYGPYDATYDPDEEHNEYGLIPAPPEAGYITSMHATLVDEEGDHVGRHEAHLHHVVFANPNRSNLMCPGFPADTFFASGKERTKMQLPDGYGYFWDAGSPPGYPGYPPTWGIVHHVMTMHEGHSTEVFVRLDLGFDAVDEGSLIDVTPVWLDVMGCAGDPVFDVRKGSGTKGVYERSLEMTVPAGGRFVALGGHLHDGGLKLRLDDMTSGEKLWVSRATYGPANRGWDLRRMSSFSGIPGSEVAEGDRVKLTAYYDSTHRWKKVMGIMVGALAPSE